MSEDGARRGYPLQSWVDARIEVAASPVQGLGMFTRQPVQAGEILIIWGGVIFTEAEIKAGKARPHSIAGIGEGLYLADPADAPDSPDYFLNHSCDPNLWMVDEITLAARRDISAGEELTADYAMWENDPDWVLQPCTCGSALCRGTITGKDWMSEELQAKYAGHFMPFINQRIRSRLHGR
jgi:SET domain-containing protein